MDGLPAPFLGTGVTRRRIETGLDEAEGSHPFGRTRTEVFNCRQLLSGFLLRRQSLANSRIM
jgi:hypothetical protein